MTIFNTLQFPAFDGASRATQPASPQLSLPADDAIQAFQQAYERPSELPQPAELPIAVELTIPAGGEEPYPTRLASASAPADRPASAREAGRLGYASLTSADAVAPERPAELPPATPETLAKVVAENLALAKELPQPIELPDRGRDVPAASKEVENVLVPTRRGRRVHIAEEVSQALPETALGVVPAVAPTASAPETAPVAGVAAKVSADTPRTASSVVIEAASAVADTLLVSPNLMHGGGEIRVQLKPDVLDGAQICIKVTGKSTQVEFASVTDDIARLMTEAQPQLIQRLAEKMPTYEVAVTVLPGNVTARRPVRKGVGRSGGEA